MVEHDDAAASRTIAATQRRVDVIASSAAGLLERGAPAKIGGHRGGERASGSVRLDAQPCMAENVNT